VTTIREDPAGVELRAEDTAWSFGSGTPASGTAQGLVPLLYGRRLPPEHPRGEPSQRLTTSISL